MDWRTASCIAVLRCQMQHRFAAFEGMFTKRFSIVFIFVIHVVDVAKTNRFYNGMY